MRSIVLVLAWVLGAVAASAPAGGDHGASACRVDGVGVCLFTCYSQPVGTAVLRVEASGHAPVAISGICLDQHAECAGLGTCEGAQTITKSVQGVCVVEAPGGTGTCYVASS